MTELKFKVGDKVNCILTEEGFAGWQNATVTEVDPTWKSFPYTCICDAYPGEQGLFAEKELELEDELGNKLLETGLIGNFFEPTENPKTDYYDKN